MVKITQADSAAAQKFMIDLSVNLTGTQLHNLAGVIAAIRRDVKEKAAAIAAEEAQTHLSCAAHARETSNEASYDRCMARFKTAERIAQAIRDLANKGKV